MRDRRSTAAAAGALAALLGLASPLLAQTAVRSVRLDIDLTAGDGSAQVQAEYVLNGAAPAPAPAPLPFELLGFGDATADEARVGDVLVPLAPGRGTMRTGWVSWDAARPTSGSSDRTVLASYRVARAVVSDGGALRAHVPVLVVDLPPEGSSPGTFRAELRLPPGWTTSESFPAGLAADGSGAHVVTLSVVPAVVSFRGREDGRRGTNVPLVLDVLAGVLVLGFSFVGWQRLREVTR